MKNLLQEAREIINKVDKEMAELFVERMRAAEMVAAHKKEHGLPILDKTREDEVIKRNAELIEDDEIRAYYVNFLADTMSVSRQYQSKRMEGMRVAYSGTEGCFAHIAASKLFPEAIKTGYGDFKEAYDAVLSGKCDIAVLPMENSYNGEVGQVTDLMFSGSLYINGVTDIAITQDLLILPDADVTIKELEGTHCSAIMPDKEGKRRLEPFILEFINKH